MCIWRERGSQAGLSDPANLSVCQVFLTFCAQGEAHFLLAIFCSTGPKLGGRSSGVGGMSGHRSALGEAQRRSQLLVVNASNSIFLEDERQEVQELPWWKKVMLGLGAVGFAAVVASLCVFAANVELGVYTTSSPGSYGIAVHEGKLLAARLEPGHNASVDDYDASHTPTNAARGSGAALESTVIAGASTSDDVQPGDAQSSLSSSWIRLSPEPEAPSWIPPAGVAAAGRPIVLILLSSRNITNVERFRSAEADVFLMDYSTDGSTFCDWCTGTMHSRGVKWELLVCHYLCPLSLPAGVFAPFSPARRCSSLSLHARAGPLPAEPLVEQKQRAVQMAVVPG